VAEALLGKLKDVVFQTDARGRWTYLNPAWEALTGHGVAASLGKSFLDHVHPADRGAQGTVFEALMAGAGGDRGHRIRCQHRDGSWRWVEVYACPDLDPAGRTSGICGTLRDITELKAAEDSLRLAASVFTHAGEGIMITDVEGTILDVNRAFERITGYSAEQVRGRNPNMLSSGRQTRSFYEAMWDSLRTHDYWQGEVWNRHRSGRLYVERLTITAIRDEQGGVRHFVGIFADVTAQMMQTQDLERIAHYDPLTGLPNRRLLAARLQQSLANARRRGIRVAVAYLDLDGFKAVNDLHGHGYGDELLIAIGRRLQDAVRECDTVCRLGGDEFVAVLDEVGGIEDCLPFVMRVLESVARPVVVRQAVLHVTGSLGLAICPDGAGIEPDQLLRQADQAMYAAKTQGKNRYALFGEPGPAYTVDAEAG
jgi:diguanylate cyclase (GGDEF)-like protein/PAS domain S-box-containing protein